MMKGVNSSMLQCTFSTTISEGKKKRLFKIKLENMGQKLHVSCKAYSI
jgi:hypothetical protein